MSCSPTTRAPGPSLSELSHRVRIEAPVRTPDDAGGATLTWALQAEAYAAIRDVSGHESLDHDRLAGHVTHSIWFRHRTDLTTTHRLMFGVRRFDIRSVLDRDGRRRFLECLCEEITS
jgi:SPP1 family predicted phage head-tail adaptor